MVESPQIGIPFQFADAKTKPIGERTHGFYNGKVPMPTGFHRLHALRLGNPLSN
jgi:hypothetical protein